MKLGNLVASALLCVSVFTAAVIGQPTREIGPPSPADGKRPNASSMTAQQRLDASIDVYRKARTYRDAGTVTFSRIVGGKEETDKDVLRFRTAFERGGRFRFQFDFRRDPRTGMWESGEANRTFTIWSKDGKLFSSLETPGDAQLDEEKVQLQIASATGISAGAAYTILPRLQIDGGKSPSTSLIDLTAPKDAGKETIAGVECWKITGETRLAGTTATLWIGTDGLVRRVRRETLVDLGKTKAYKDSGRTPPPESTEITTTDFKPVLNEAKTDANEFAPPEGK